MAARLPAEPPCPPSLTTQCRHFFHWLVAGQSQQRSRCSAPACKLSPSWKRAFPGGQEQSPFPPQSPPEPEAAFHTAQASMPPWHQEGQRRASAQLLSGRQHHTALTRQCALNSCSWLFRLSFMATSALRLCRMLRRHQTMAQGRPLRCDFYELPLRPH